MSSNRKQYDTTLPVNPLVNIVDSTDDDMGDYYTLTSEPSIRRMWCSLGLYGLGKVIVTVATVGFFISGAVLWAKEFRSIPECANRYRSWTIIMTLLFGLSVCQTRKNHDLRLTPGTIASLAGTIAVCAGMISGLGYYEVWRYPSDSCDLSAIHRLTLWTRWIVLYYLVVAGVSLTTVVATCWIKLNPSVRIRGIASSSPV